MSLTIVLGTGTGIWAIDSEWSLPSCGMVAPGAIFPQANLSRRSGG